jgi:hypothetical protein
MDTISSLSQIHFLDFLEMSSLCKHSLLPKTSLKTRALENVMRDLGGLGEFLDRGRVDVVLVELVSETCWMDSRKDMDEPKDFMFGIEYSST